MSSPSTRLGMRSIPARIRREWKTALLSDQRGKCEYCKKKLSYETATFDHITPVSKNGETRLRNLVLACSKCNHEKADK